MSKSIKDQVEAITRKEKAGWFDRIIAWIVTIAILLVCIPFMLIGGIAVWIQNARQSQADQISKDLRQVDYRLQEIQHMLDDDEAEEQGREILAGFMKEQNEPESPSES